MSSVATRHERFVWHAAKAAANAAKHRVTFPDAAEMLLHPLADDWCVEDYDAAHSGSEDRWVTTGPHPDDEGILIRVVWADSHDAAGRPATRIITRTQGRR